MDIRSAVRGTKATNIPTSTIEEPKVTPQEQPNLKEDEYSGNLLLQEYMNFLKENDVTKEDLMDIAATILTTGSIEWGDSLLGGRVQVRFRMREGWLEDLIASKVDTHSSNKNISMSRFSNLIRMYNLAGSLAHYNGKDIPMSTPEDFEAALSNVEHMPYPVLSMLSQRLAVFDRAVIVALSDWALKNFTEPQTENS